MVDVNRQIRMAVKTGKVELGGEAAVASLGISRARLLILASNCSRGMRDELVYRAGQGEIPVYLFQGSSLDLGALCEKPFPVSALVIREPGDSEVLRLVEKE